MKVAGKMCQLAGPVSGRPRGEVEADFAAARDRLLELGAASVWNPMEQIPATWTGVEGHAKAMRPCLRRVITQTELLVLLPGWQSSKGACLEKATAEAVDTDTCELWEVEM